MSCMLFTFSTGVLNVLVTHILGFPGGSVVKHLPAMQETRIRSLDREDPLQKEMATHSSIAWTVSWTEKFGGEWSIR